jgi:transcriptional regulator with XRE-family HTH domain
VTAGFIVPKPIGAGIPRLNRTLIPALGTVITDLRAARSWSQDEIAYRIGYDQGFIRRVERGTANLSFNVLCNLAHVFSLRLLSFIELAKRLTKKLSVAGSSR